MEDKKLNYAINEMLSILKESKTCLLSTPDIENYKDLDI